MKLNGWVEFTVLSLVLFSRFSDKYSAVISLVISTCKRFKKIVFAMLTVEQFTSTYLRNRKRVSFSAICTKHKPSLYMLACVSKQLPYRRRRPNSTQQHLNEITKNKQGWVYVV